MQENHTIDSEIKTNETTVHLATQLKPSTIFSLHSNAIFEGSDYTLLKEDELRMLAEGTIRLINLCVTENPEALFFLDRSARPASMLFRETWRHLFPEIPYPQIRHINVGSNNSDKVQFTNEIYSDIDPSGKFFIIDESINSGASVENASRIVNEMYPDAKIIPMAAYDKFPSWYGKMQTYMGLTDDSDSDSLLSRIDRSDYEKSQETKLRSELSKLAQKIASQVDKRPVGIIPVIPQTLGKILKWNINPISQIWRSTKQGIPLSSSDLTFLHEIDAPIQPIGRYRDPRIDEIKARRNLREDVATMYDLDPSQIATNAEEITPDTKIYIGDIAKKGIFPKLAKLDHIYTSFPNREIIIKQISAQAHTIEQVEKQLEETGVEVSYRAKAAISSLEFSSLQDATVVLLSAKDLGLHHVSYKDVIQKAHELGLQDCQREIGPLLRLAYQNQPFFQDLYIITQEGYNNERSFGLKKSYEGLSMTAPEDSFLDRELTFLDARTEFAFVIPNAD